MAVRELRIEEIGKMRAKFFKCLSSRIADFEGVLEHYLKRIQVSKSVTRDSCELQEL